ncbi:hypothetical protein D3C71_968000 [compost metagenome]
MWSTDKIEMEETTGGKGGAPEHTTYRYFVHMGVVLCETPRDGSEVVVVQIFQDGKLIYDARSGIPIGSALASEENPHAFAVLYQGHADQLPDPGEEAWMGGPGSVPAYRGVVRLRMNAVECPNGRVPQFSFVLSNSFVYTADSSLGDQFELAGALRYSYSRVPTNGDPAIIFAERGEPVEGYDVQRKIVDVFALGLDYCEQVSTLVPDDYSYQYNALQGSADISAVCFRAFTASTDQDTGKNVVKDETGSEKHFLVDTPAFGQSNSCWTKHGNRFAICGDNTQLSTTAILFDWDSGLQVGRDDAIIPSGMWMGASYVWVRALIAGVLTMQARSREDFSVLAASALPADLQGTGINGASFAADGAVLKAYARKSSPETSLWTISVDEGAGTLSFAQSGVTLIAVETPTTGSIAIGIGGASVVGVSGGPPTNDYRLFVVSYQRVVVGDVNVSQIIEDLCKRAGEGRYDLSEMPSTDVVHGYKLQNPASARANIDPLLTAFAAYMVDEDGAIKFKKYQDIASVASISYDELGQAEAGAESADAMPLNRSQEVDLPRSVSVSYLDPSHDYQTASEKESRQITESNEDMIVELPLATSSDHAKRVAQTILFDRWRAQNTRSCKVSRKYAFLSPGDGVTVEYPRGTWRLWRITSMTDTGALCELNVEPGDAELYTQTATGATGYVGQQVTPLPPPTRMVIGDWPLLRDADNNPGIYTAFAALGTGGRGATLYVGDDDLNLQERGSVFSYTSVGVAQGALGGWTPNIRDQANTLVVSAPAGAFASATFASLIADRTVNACALGAPGRWEILQFASASYLGDGQWLIYDFLRGQRGTEFARGTHEAGDMLVLLAPAGMLRPNMDIGALNQSKQYRAVTLGRSVNSVTSQGYSNTGEGLRPFSPVNLRHEVSGSDLVFTWHRRTRLSTNWLAGVVPLGEASEAYTLTLCTDGTFSAVKRVFAVTSPAATYTAAQMAADGYTPGQPLYVRVRQVSDTVGAGHALEEIL